MAAESDFVCGETFVRQRVEMGGKGFYQCVWFDCVLVLAAGEWTEPWCCIARSCTFEGAGWQEAGNAFGMSTVESHVTYPPGAMSA